MSDDPKTSAPARDFVVLALNSGSSSLKLALYAFRQAITVKLASAEVEEIGRENSHAWLRVDSNFVLNETRSFPDTTAAAEFLIEAIRKSSLPAPQVVGHRIV